MCREHGYGSPSCPVLGRLINSAKPVKSDDGSDIGSSPIPIQLRSAGFPAEFRVTAFYPRFTPTVVKPPAWGICCHPSTWGVGISPTQKPSYPDHCGWENLNGLSAFLLTQQQVTQVSDKRVAGSQLFKAISSLFHSLVSAVIIDDALKAKGSHA